MYLINTTLKVNWYLLTGAAPPLEADLDIRITPPEGSSIYLPGEILLNGSYIPSTATTKGFVTYNFTPNALGLWKVGISTGTSALNRDYYTHDIVVSTNDVLTKKLVKSSLL